MRKIIPLQEPGRKRAGKNRVAKAQTPPTRQAGEEEGMVTIQLKDGTSKTISGSNLELDIEYQEGVPYLVVRDRR